MKKFVSFLFSMSLTALLLAIFFLAIAIATFIENDYGPVGSKAMVYNARWFEFLLFLMTINAIGSIFRNGMISRKKIAILTFHVAFIVIIIGAAITRYFGYEGNLRIYEGKQENIMQSADNYIQFKMSEGDQFVSGDEKVFLTPLKKVRYHERVKLGVKDIELRVKDYYSKAGEILEETPEGDPYLELTFSDQFGRRDIFLKEGDQFKIGGRIFIFEDNPDSNMVRFLIADGKLKISAPDTIFTMLMSLDATDTLLPDSSHDFAGMKLYSYENVRFVLKNFYPSAKRKIVQASDNSPGNLPEALVFEIKSGNTVEEVIVFGRYGQQANWKEININGIKAELAFGSKEIVLPFNIFLRDFQLDRYPGSNNPSSYASEVTVIDDEMNEKFDFRIYMNHILNYRGYRFYQSSYDGRNEEWSLLSVNHDFLGTIVTYLGYFLMTLGMILSLINRNNRFNALVKSVRYFRNKRTELVKIAVILILFTAVFSTSHAQEDVDEKVSAALDSMTIEQDHARKFNRLLTIDGTGRVEPINTLAIEVLRKLTYKNSMYGLTADQIFLGMLSNPNAWANIPMIRVGDEQIQKTLGINSKFASYFDFIGENGQYKLYESAQLARVKKPALRSKHENYLLKVDERFNIMLGVFNGDYLRIFPKPHDKNLMWYKPSEAPLYFSGDTATFVQKILEVYYGELQMAMKTGDYGVADTFLSSIDKFQKHYGSQVIPPQSKIDLEIKYNNSLIFRRLAFSYLIIGFFLLMLNLFNILIPRFRLKVIIRVFTVLVILLFLMHAAGLGVRWYISGHAPWSNGFEALVFIGWATVLAGIIFSNRSQITLSATSILAFIILMVANLNTMDPEITNLVPVLKSYWLLIHVAVITASYGFLGLGAINSIINFFLMLVKNARNRIRIDYTIREFTAVSEMSLIVGLFLLSIGTFLGGVWANESWGRYWGWDPKETWALATMVAYIFILHMRFMPGLKSTFVFNAAALFGFGTVIMTYFGVNYYLSGLHSYAQGDPVPIPKWVPITVFLFIILTFVAYWRSKKADKLSDDHSIIHDSRPGN